MKKRTLLIILLTFAMVFSSCGQKKQSQSRLTVASKNSTSNNSKSAENTTNNQNYINLHNDLMARLNTTGLSEPIRPSFKKPDSVKPVHLKAHENIANSKLPRIDITLPDDYQLTKENYTAGTITITNAGDNNLPASSGQVRLRGNSTVAVSKKAFKIKFDSKQSIFGRDPEKSWTLLANYFDVTGIHNYIAYGLYDKLTPEGTFSSLCEFVDVYVNGDYQGVYNLCDQVETGKGRVPLKATIGATPEQSDYLIEEDYRISAEEPENEDLEWFWLTWSNDIFKVKSPENKDGLTKEHTAYIKSYVDDCHIAIRLKDWDAIQQLIDVDSFIIGTSVAEIAKNCDIVQASLFMYKKADGKLTFGPVWDFDFSFGSCSNPETGAPKGFSTINNAILGGLMEVPEYKERFKEYFNTHLNEMISYINSTIDQVDSKYLENFENEFKNWGIKSIKKGVEEMRTLNSHAEQTAFMKKWVAERAAWLHTEYNK